MHKNKYAQLYMLVDIETKSKFKEALNGQDSNKLKDKNANEHKRMMTKSIRECMDKKLYQREQRS